MFSRFTHMLVAIIKIAKVMYIVITVKRQAASRMNSSNTATHAEQRIIKFAYQLLGNNLAEFLLSGYGIVQANQCRTFIAKSINPIKGKSTHRFDMVSYSELGLPRGRDPLVLASLIYLLLMTSGSTDKVEFMHSQLLERLGWDNSNESILIIDLAIERYFSTRLLSSYKTTEVQLADNDIAERTSITARFVPDFIKNIETAHKYFFDIDFELFQSLRQIT
jgi:hypothetical protein